MIRVGHFLLSYVRRYSIVFPRPKNNTIDRVKIRFIKIVVMGLKWKVGLIIKNLPKGRGIHTPASSLVAHSICASI